MRNDSHRPVLLMLALALLTPAVRGQVDPKPLDEYRGFRVDYNDVRSEPTYETLRAAVNKQIQMVVAVGLPDNTLAFFRSVPLYVVRGNPGFGGQYVKRDKKIALAASFLERGHKPALLHEFLHAYHNQVLPDGYQNKTVLMYYERAKATNAYDAKSHMMANVKEYFASAATAYLFGVTQLEPFTREKVEKNQPAFHKYLQSLFGPGAGKYRGTIAPPSPPVKGVMNGAKIRGFWDIAVSVRNPFGRDAGPGVRNPPHATEPRPARPAGETVSKPWGTRSLAQAAQDS